MLVAGLHHHRGTFARWDGNAGPKAPASLLGLLREIGARREKSPSEVALRLLIRLEGVLPIAGAKNASQALGNAGALTFTLEPDEVDALRCHLNRPEDGLGESPCHPPISLIVATDVNELGDGPTEGRESRA